MAPKKNNDYQNLQDWEEENESALLYIANCSAILFEEMTVGVIFLFLPQICRRSILLKTTSMEFLLTACLKVFHNNHFLNHRMAFK